MLEVAQALKDTGAAQFVDINDNPRARARMSGIMSAVAIERTVGLETIPHQTPRDTTISGLESLLLGAHAEGVRNILAVTGDPPEEGDYPGAGGVYHVEAIGLVQIIERLNRGEDFHGRAIDAPTHFFTGVAVNPTADDLELELHRFEQKLEAGAKFAMTQILFDLSYLETFFERFGGPSPIPLLVGIWPLRSHQLAQRLHNEVPGIVVPDHVQQALLDAGPNAPDVGANLAHELVARSKELAAGSTSSRRSDSRSACWTSFDLARAVAGRHRPGGTRKCATHDLRRDAVADVAARARGEDRRLHASLCVDRGPARVAVAHASTKTGDRPEQRPVPVAVAREHGLRPADAPRDCGERPALREAEDRDGCTRLRLGERERRRVEAGHAQHGDVVPPVDVHGVRAQPRNSTDGLDGRVLLAGDDVRGGHDELGRSDPAATGHAEPARGAEHLQHRRRRLRERRGRRAPAGRAPRPERRDR